MSSLTWFLILFSTPAPAAHWRPLWPRLLTYAPAPGCAHHLAGADPVPELTALLDLSHPLVRRYLELRTRDTDTADAAFHADLRVMALIYGDQPDFDLRASNGPSAYDRWTRGLSGWVFRSRATRRELAERFVLHLADIEWRYDTTVPGSTLYLRDFNVTRAFRSDSHLFWNSMIGRHWDVDDREHVAERLHRVIEDSRRRLTADQGARARLIERLSARLGSGTLPAVTRAARQFLGPYRRFLDRH